MISIFSLARRLDLGWHDAYDFVVDGDVPPPVYVGGNLARWRNDDIASWQAAGCPVGPELDDEAYMQLQNALLAELRENDTRKEKQQ